MLLITTSNHHIAYAHDQVVVRVNGVKNKLFALAVEDIQLTIDATRHQLGIGATAIPDIHDCLNLLLPTPFLRNSTNITYH